MFHLYDGLNAIRVRIEKDPLGRAPRSIITEMLNPRSEDTHVWVFEGRDHLSKRRLIYPAYKDRPATMTDGFFALVGLIREAMTYTHAIQIAVPGYEADDVIAHLVCQQAGKTPIFIHTTDRDMNQLLVLPGVKSMAKPKEGIDPKYVRLYKTYVGDSSDVIPGLKGFGDLSWAACDKEKLMVAHLNPDQGLYVDAGMTPRLAAKAVENKELLAGFWKIVGFLPIHKDIGSYMEAGKFNPEKADELLRQFHH